MLTGKIRYGNRSVAACSNALVWSLYSQLDRPRKRRRITSCQAPPIGLSHPFGIRQRDSMDLRPYIPSRCLIWKDQLGFLTAVLILHIRYVHFFVASSLETLTMTQYQQRLWKEMIEDKRDRLDAENFYDTTYFIKNFDDFQEYLSESSTLSTRGRTSRHIGQFVSSLTSLQLFAATVQSVVQIDQASLVMWSGVQTIFEVCWQTTS